MKFVIYLFLLSLLISGCSLKTGELAIINIKGSDSMLKLTENLAEEYMRQNPGISIYVKGGGTTLGIKSLIHGDIDICTASRNLLPEEAKTLADYYRTVGLFYLVAKDALCIYVNPNNPVKHFTLDQLRNIFECKVTDWSVLGGKHLEIIPVIRNPNSGTHLYFKEHVLSGDEYCDEAIVVETTPDIINFIEQNENSIGYGSIGYKGKVVYAKIEGIEPSEKNARNDTYPITRYLHFYTSNVPKGIVKNFIDWVLSPEGQKVIEQSSFIPLWELPK